MSRVRATLFGAAFGDAIAAPVEFEADATSIRAALGGPNRFDVTSASRVTDDTQMMLAVALAIGDAAQALEPDTLADALRARFVAWLRDPENNRAPGNTCLSACYALESGTPWVDATVAGSKGCGANMRVQPCAFLPDEVWAGASQLQAAMTHGHPTGVAAAHTTAAAIRWLADGMSPGDLIPALRALAHEERERYRERWLGALWKRGSSDTAGGWMRRGWADVDRALVRAASALSTLLPTDDVSARAGDGWIAEEALASALVAFLSHPGDGRAVLFRAASTRGDSDSIACLAGAFAGAHLGDDAWPGEWFEHVEYRAELNAAVALLDG